MRVKMKFSKITKNDLADPEGFYVSVRLFLTDKETAAISVSLEKSSFENEFFLLSRNFF